jgi:hypothetical protein
MLMDMICELQPDAGAKMKTVNSADEAPPTTTAVIRLVPPAR